MPKTVWVLGAGFARSLGAPLLADLFRQEEDDDILAYFPEPAFPGLAQDIAATQIAFNWGKDVDHLWADAEQFLAFVDDAYSAGAPEKKKRLERLTMRAGRYNVVSRNHTAPAEEVHGVNGAMRSGLQRASRRALAAETSRFMMTSRDGELWLPYRTWASGLTAENDTIITFNYDVLLDELGKEAPFTIPMEHESPEAGRIPVLKLHGSANWLVEGEAWKKLRDYEALTYPTGVCPAIAAPGRSKATSGKPPFPRLWKMAEDAIEQAQWVIFVGYRFPPTDALARIRLGRALAANDRFNVLRIDTVLGPDIESNDSRRMFTLLRAARGKRYLGENPLLNVFPQSRYVVIERQPIWAEDFLTTYRDLAQGQQWGPTG